MYKNYIKENTVKHTFWMLWHKYLELLFTQGLEKFEKWEKFYPLAVLWLQKFMYSPFHKTLPRPSAFCNWISERFYETGWSKNGRRLKTFRMVSVLNSDPLSFKEKVWTSSSDLNRKVSDISSYFFLSGLLPRTSHVQW